MTTTQQAEAARDRGYDRAQTLAKQDLPIDADQIASELYPDSTELANACAAGLRSGADVR